MSEENVRSGPAHENVRGREADAFRDLRAAGIGSADSRRAQGWRLT